MGDRRDDRYRAPDIVASGGARGVEYIQHRLVVDLRHEAFRQKRAPITVCADDGELPRRNRMDRAAVGCATTEPGRAPGGEQALHQIVSRLDLPDGEVKLPVGIDDQSEASSVVTPSLNRFSPRSTPRKSALCT